VPLVTTPSQRFDELVLDAVEHLEDRWHEELRGLEFAVEEVPPVGDVQVYDDEIESGGVPLARLLPGGGGQPPRVVVYRRPLELRAFDRIDLADLVHDVVLEEVAHYLGLDPETVDPGWAGGDGDEDDDE
jgi:predicted Zn-dependent protease with MMP-like domain